MVEITPDWLRHKMRVLNIKQREMATVLGMTDHSPISRFLSGTRQLKASEAVEIERFISSREQAEPGVADSVGDSISPAAAKYVEIPRIGVHLSGGPGTSVLGERKIDDIPFTRQFLRRKLGRDAPTGLFMVEVNGDSMEPSIKSGDLVMIDTTVRSIDGSICAFRQGNELLVKRLQRVGAGVQVISENETVPDYVLGSADMPDFEVVGQLRWIGRVL